MNVRVKILPISGINERTVNGIVEVAEGATIGNLLEKVNEEYRIDLMNHSNYIALLDGSVINTQESMEKIPEGLEEFTVIPVISGG